MGVFDQLFKKGKKDNNAKANFIDDEWIEVTAQNREDAIERAATALNANEDHLEIQWLSKDGKKLRARKRSESQVQEDKPAKETKKASGARKKRKKQDKDGNQANYEAKNDEVEEEQEQEPYEEEVEEETEHGNRAKELLSQIVTSIDEPASVELFETNKTIRLEIESNESGLFIGKHGQTLEAIQHLMMKMMMKDDHQKYLVIDAEDYRIRREESLESKARKLAKKARKEKRPIGVEPMNAIDRRIVHVALKGEPGVETKSIGEGSSRRVLIVPKGHNGGRRSGGNRRGRGNFGGGERYQNNARRDKEYEGPSRDAFDDADGM